jgi:uncharacterized coiled-coil DUF342 family protein
METGIIIAVIAAASAFLSSLVTQWFQKSKNSAETQSAIASGAHMAVDAITDVLDQVKEQLREAHDQLAEARLEIKELRHENAELRKSVHMLNVQINELREMSIDFDRRQQGASTYDGPERRKSRLSTDSDPA